MLDLILGFALFISLITDLRERKILNMITLPSILIGIVYHTWMAGWEGFLFSGSGFLLGLALLFIPYLMGGMGAGDVKLLAAIGSLKGAYFVFQSFLYICLAGGIIALLIVIKRKQLKNTITRCFYSLGFLRGNTAALQILDRNELHHAFPYGVPIVIGTVIVYTLGGSL